METARFVTVALGTFLSVLSLSFAVFKYWKGKQEKKFDRFCEAVTEMVRREAEDRKGAFEYLRERIKALESADNNMAQRFENRLSVMEGELKGIKSILQSINNWFIANTGKG